MEHKPDIVIVGSGLFGLTVARQYVEHFPGRVLVLERRNHPGGNSWSTTDVETGIEVHHYGTHLFHTSNSRVIEFVQRYADFTDYRHKVFSIARGKVYSLPFSLLTISQVFGSHFTPMEARRLIEREIELLGIDKKLSDRSLEDKALSSVGKTIYELLVKGYTTKQWSTDPANLPASVISRLPVRFNYNDEYFDDAFQGLPRMGYGDFISNLADHPRIEIKLGSDYFDSKYCRDGKTLTIYTGPIDKYFEYSLGRLGWRTLDFDLERVSIPDYQGTAVMNYADEEIPFTRIHEFQHLHPERENSSKKTLIMKEFSRFAEGDDEPYYPINTESDRLRLEGYRALAKLEKNVIFGGRLGSYRYLDMDMAIASAFVAFENEIKPRIKQN